MIDVPVGRFRWPDVDAIELVRIALPLVTPHVYAGGEERARNVVLVRAVDADGVEGWGECSALSSPGYGSETTDSAWVALRDELAPAWLAGAPPPRDRPMAYAAVEMAAFDLELRHRGESLAGALSERFGEPRRSLSWCAVLGLSATVSDVDRAVQQGASQVKLKVAPSSDLDRLLAARERHPDLPMAVDANGSFPSVDAVPAALAGLDLVYVEQPLAPGELDGSARLAERLGVAIALDESITSAPRLADALERGACAVVSVKPARLGGLVEAADVLHLAAERKVDAFVGGMLETGVGRAAALALAAQRPCTLPCDTGPTSRYYVHDVTPPFEPDAEGRLPVPAGAGIGVVPDPRSLAEHDTERVLLRA